MAASPQLAAIRPGVPAIDPIRRQQDERVRWCLNSLQGTISSTPEPVPLWTDATLNWSATDPGTSIYCTGLDVKLYVNGYSVPPVGSQIIRRPIADTEARLIAASGVLQRTLATTAIKVEMPSIITIYENDMAPLLVQALRFDENRLANGNVDPGARRYIYIEHDVELDLTGWESIPITGGVTLIGKGTALQTRPRLYTTVRSDLFSTDGHNVRISNLRIEGPDHPEVVQEEEDNRGIGLLVSGVPGTTVNIEIDHNEIYGWSQAAVRVNDCDGQSGCTDTEPSPGHDASLAEPHGGAHPR